MKLFEKLPSLSVIGFLQALGVAAYCALVVGFFTLMEKIFSQPGFLGLFLMLVIFVFSAAVTGSLVFGYAAYLALDKKIKEALQLVSYTLLYSLGLVLLALIVMTIVVTF